MRERWQSQIGITGSTDTELPVTTVKGTAQRSSATYGRRGRRVGVPKEDWERLS